MFLTIIILLWCESRCDNPNSSLITSAFSHLTWISPPPIYHLTHQLIHSSTFFSGLRFSSPILEGKVKYGSKKKWQWRGGVKSLLALITSPIYSSESDMKINEPIYYFKQGYFHEWFLFSIYHRIHLKLSIFNILESFFLAFSSVSPHPSDQVLFCVYLWLFFVFYFVQHSANGSNQQNEGFTSVKNRI